MAGYSIGTPVLNNCFNISNSGAITVDYRLITPLLYATKIKASNATAITLEDDVLISTNLNISWNITASNSNPFYIAGRVAANGTALNSKGQIGFSSTRTAAGNYVITPNTNVGNTSYIVSLTCQVDGASGFARLNGSLLSSSSFTVLTYAGTVLADVIIHFSVLN